MTIKTAEQAIAWLNTVKHFNCGEVIKIIKDGELREAALKEDLAKWQGIASRRTGERTEFINERNDARDERDALQQRLTVAEQRVGPLEAASREMLRIAGIANQGSNAYNRAIINLNAALKPAEEGEGS